MKRIEHAGPRRLRDNAVLLQALAAGFAVALNRVAVSATDNWTNPAGGNWETTSNWSLNAIPTSSDAYFNNGSGTPYTVTLAGAEIAFTVNVQNNNVTFDTTNNTLESLDARFGLNVIAGSGQTSSLKVLGNGGYGVQSDMNGFNIGATGTGVASFTDNGVRLTCDHGNYNFGAGSIVSIDSLMRGGTANAGLIVRGTATISTATLQGAITVGGPGGAVLNGNGLVSTQYGPVDIGSGGIGTINAALDNTGADPINIGVDSTGTLNVDGVADSGESFNVGTSTAAGVMNVTNGGSVVGLLTTTVGSHGTVNVIGGKLTMHAVVVMSGGQLNGSGGATVGTIGGDTTGTFTNDGTITVLNTAASSKLTITSPYSQSPGGVLDIALADETSPGSGSYYTGALFSTTGPASLNGTLDVTSPASFPISPGQSFQILNLNTETGAFSNIILPPLSGGLTWNTQSLYSNGTISVVPEPAIGGSLGMAALLLRRRRRSREKECLN